MEIGTICRYQLPIVVIVFNNNGVYRGDDVNSYSTDPAPTVFTKGSPMTSSSKHSGHGIPRGRLGHTFGSTTTGTERKNACTDQLRHDPTAGTESDTLQASTRRGESAIDERIGNSGEAIPTGPVEGIRYLLG